VVDSYTDSRSFGAGCNSPPAVKVRERVLPQSLWNPGADSESLDGRRNRERGRRRLVPVRPEIAGRFLLEDDVTQDVQLMREAISLAERGRGHTSPNPRVGAVIVRDGKIVGRGYHERYGAPHAEVNAIADAGEDARGADLFVTLEPCCVWGNTPPCTDTILRAGIRRVVIPINDPNPDVAGRGIAVLREAGVVVEIGCLADEARHLNAPYLRFRETGLPLVTLKLAVTLDGRITTARSDDRWISSEQSRLRVHAMRGGSDAVLVGIETVLADDPELTDRRTERASRQPARIVADSQLRIPVEGRLVSTARVEHTVVACLDDETLATRAAALESRGVVVWRLPPAGDGRLDALAMMRRAAREGITDILCEGGATLGTALLDQQLATRLAVFVAPKLSGAGGVPALGDLRGNTRLETIVWERVGDDMLLMASVRPGASTQDQPRERDRETSSREAPQTKDATTCSQG